MVPVADILGCVWRSSPTSFGISRGKKKYGRADRATRLAATRNPSHQAPTQRGSLLVSCTSAATREEKRGEGHQNTAGTRGAPHCPKGAPPASVSPKVVASNPGTSGSGA